MSIRIAVIGRNGQVARALAEAGPAFGVEVVSLGRPELDLAVPETVEPILRVALANIVVNAAAYTAVDQAEREPARLPQPPAHSVYQSFTFPPTMSSMAIKQRLMSRMTKRRRPASMALRSSPVNGPSLPLIPTM